MLSCKGESDMSRSNSGSSPVSTFPSPLFFREVNQAEMRASDFVVLNRRAADALQTHLSLPLSTRLTLYLYSHWLLLLLLSLRRHYMLAMWWLIPSWKSWPSKAHWFWFVYARACVCACVIVAKWREFLALQARPLKGKPNPGTDQSASSRWAGPQSLIPLWKQELGPAGCFIQRCSWGLIKVTHWSPISLFCFTLKKNSDHFCVELHQSVLHKPK